MEKKKVGILGATGMVGQRFITLLKDHLWFEITEVIASPKSAGKPYKEAVQGKWALDCDIPENVANLIVKSLDDKNLDLDFVFSALGSNIAQDAEEEFAKAGIKVVSNARSHRHDSDVPMVIPEINSDHLDIIPKQQKNRNWKGFIAVKPNCSLQSYMVALYPLHLKFGVKRVIVTTMQALSGAGHPGVSSLDIIDNVVPYIKGEEEKSEIEPNKIMGRIEGDRIINDESIKISAHCNRVNVIDGHLATVSVEFEKKPTREDIIKTWQEFEGQPQKMKLPFAPEKAIYIRDEPNRPQPRIDRSTANGMGITVGRLRECNVFDWRFCCISHNTIRGAAGGAILVAEMLCKKGYI